MGLQQIKPLKFKTRKSGFEDSFFFIAVLMAMAIFVLVLVKVWASIHQPLADSISSVAPSQAAAINNNFSTISDTIDLFDKLLPFILIGLFAFVFIGAALYMNHPIMIFVGIILLAVSILLAVIYANVYHQISTSGDFADANTHLPLTEIFMKYLPYLMIVLFIGIVAAVIWSRGGGATSL